MNCTIVIKELQYALFEADAVRGVHETGQHRFMLQKYRETYGNLKNNRFYWSSTFIDHGRLHEMHLMKKAAIHECLCQMKCVRL